MAEALLNKNEFSMGPGVDGWVHVYESLADGVMNTSACNKRILAKYDVPHDVADNMLVCEDCLERLKLTIPGLDL